MTHHQQLRAGIGGKERAHPTQGSARGGTPLASLRHDGAMGRQQNEVPGAAHGLRAWGWVEVTWGATRTSREGAQRNAR
jgi:hypothetical protein